MNLRCKMIAAGMLLMIVNGSYAQDTVSAARQARYLRYLNFFSLVKAASVQPHWLRDGNRFWYAENDAAKTVYLFDPVKNTTNKITQSDSLYKSTLAAVPVQPDTLPKIFSPDNTRYAFVKDYNIWLNDRERLVQLTTGGNKDLSWSIPDGGWSADGDRLVIRRSDIRKVHHLPVLSYSETDESVNWEVYAKSGGGIENTDLYIVDINSREQVHVATAGEDHYLFPVGWQKDGTEFILMRLDRECKTLELLAADAATGKCRMILTEQQKNFVAGMDFIIGGWRRQCMQMDDGTRFLWLSERDGWNHVYLYRLDGTLIRQLTSGSFPVTEITRVDEKNGWLYFKANAERHLYHTNLYRVDLAGRHFKKLTAGTGPHGIAFSPSGRYFIDRYSDPDHPPVVEVRSSEGKLVRVLKTTDTTELNRAGWLAPESFIAKAADGKTDIYGILYRPADFDASKKYPVVEFIYAGPIAPVVSSGFLPGNALALQAQALAQLGYITVMIDGRGTTGRSKAFQDAVYGNIGRFEIPDHVAAVRQIGAKYPWIDLNRVGIFGHSWGGYFALRAMLTTPDLYKVGIASAPGELTEATEVNEPYMGLPKNNPAGYAFGSNPALAGQLKGKLLFIHGTSNVNAPFSTTVRMIDALIKAGKPYDLLLLPGQDHYYQGVSDAYVNDAVSRYFKSNL